MSETSFVETAVSKAKSFLTPRSSGGGNMLLDDPFTAQHRVRRERFGKLWKYYLGDQDAPLKTKAGQPDFNVVENITKQIVNDSVNFLFGPGVSFEIDGEEGRNREEQIIDDFWKAGISWNPALFLQELGQAGSVTGIVFVRLYPSENGRHRLVLLDSATVDVVTKPNDITDVLEYHVIWYDGKQWTRDRIWRESGGTTWTIDAEIYLGQGSWRPAGSEKWPYDFAPVFPAKNLPLAHSFWGLPDIDGAGLNDVVNRTASDVNKILGYHAFPWEVVYGITPGQLQKSVVEVGPGRMLALPQEARVEALEMQSSLESSRSFKEDTKQQYMGESDSVRLDPQNVQVGGLSGFAIQLLYMPLLAKTKKKRATYGNLLAQINHAILVLSGIKNPNYVMTKWKSPLPQNETEMAQIATQLSATFNQKGAAEVAGYSADEVEKLTERMGFEDVVQ